MTIYKGNTEITDLQKGSTKIQEVYAGSNLVWQRGVWFYSSYNGSKLCQVNALDQSTGWVRNDSWWKALDIAINPSNDLVVGYGQSKVVKFDAANGGNKSWEYSTDNTVRSVAFGHNGDIYAATDNNTVYKLDSDGNKQWDVTCGSGSWIRHGLEVGKNDTFLFVLTDQDYAYVLHTSDGSEKDYYYAPADQYWGVAIYDNSYVYTGEAQDNGLKGWDWNGDYLTNSRYYQLDGNPQSVAVDSDGYIYVVTWNNKLWKFQDTGSSFNKVDSVTSPDNPMDVAVTKNYIGVASEYYNNIQFYEKDLTHIGDSSNVGDSCHGVDAEPGVYGTFPTDW